MLVVIAEAEEQERLERFLLAGGDPKDFNYLAQREKVEGQEFEKGLEKFILSVNNTTIDAKSHSLGGARLLAESFGKKLAVLLPDETYVDEFGTTITFDESLHFPFPVTVEEANNMFPGR